MYPYLNWQLGYRLEQNRYQFSFSLCNIHALSKYWRCSQVNFFLISNIQLLNTSDAQYFPIQWESRKLEGVSLPLASQTRLIFKLLIIKQKNTLSYWSTTTWPEGKTEWKKKGYFMSNTMQVFRRQNLQEFCFGYEVSLSLDISRNKL